MSSFNSHVYSAFASEVVPIPTFDTPMVASETSALTSAKIFIPCAFFILYSAIFPREENKVLKQ